MFDQPVRNVKYVEIREDIAQGQRIETFQITADTHSGAHFPLYQGTCVGNRKICVLQDPFQEQNPLLSDTKDYVEKLMLFVTAARDEVALKEINVY
mgnify:CR=1 FL=1